MEKLGDNSLLETRTKERNRKHIRRTIMVPTFAKVYVFQCMLTILSPVVVSSNIFMFVRFILAKPL